MTEFKRTNNAIIYIYVAIQVQSAPICMHVPNNNKEQRDGQTVQPDSSSKCNTSKSNVEVITVTFVFEIRQILS